MHANHVDLVHAPETSLGGACGADMSACRLTCQHVNSSLSGACPASRLNGRGTDVPASCTDVAVCSAEERKFQDTGAGQKRQTAMQRVREREREQRQLARQEAMAREKALRCTV